MKSHLQPNRLAAFATRFGTVVALCWSFVAAFGGAYAQTAVPANEPLTACQERLNSHELQNVKTYIDENGAAVTKLFNRRLSGLDCTFDEIKKYLLDLDFKRYKEIIRTNDSWISVRYRPYHLPIISLFYQGYGGSFKFDKNGKFVDSSWGVPK